MNIFSETKQRFNDEIEKLAHSNVVKKLQKEGVNPDSLSSIEFQKLVDMEKEILKSDTKKVGVGIGIGFLISSLIGF